MDAGELALRNAEPMAEGELTEPPAEPIGQQTAAQGKIDAVAHLTMKVYERASTLVITPEESKALLADFTDDAFVTGAGGKSNLIYIEHAALRDRFNSVLGIGQWSIIPRARWEETFRTSTGKTAKRVFVEAMLCVRGCFVGEAIGDMDYYPDGAATNYGDACEGAKSAAFRRCAKEFGVGLQAWKKSWVDGWWARKNGKAPPQPSKQPAPPIDVDAVLREAGIVLDPLTTNTPILNTDIIPKYAAIPKDKPGRGDAWNKIVAFARGFGVLFSPAEKKFVDPA